MKTIRWATVAMLLGASYTVTANAQTSASSSVEQPVSARQSAFQLETFNAVADAGTSPSNVPPAPPMPAAPSSGTAAVSSGTAGTTAASDTGSTAPEAKKDDAPPADEGPYKLFHGPELDAMHLDIRGFADLGYTYNNDRPQSHINGPVAYDDHDDEIQLNQFYLITERVTKVENNCGTDFGYRLDMLYGSDHRFTQTTPGTGWDGDWNEGSNEYGLSIPQIYVDLAVNKTIFRIGHFYAPCGYESAMGQDAPFYSRSYQFLYAEPTSLWGGEAMYTYNDNWVFNAGLDTGWNDFDSPNKSVNFFGGFNWTSKSKDTTLNSEIFVGDTDPKNDLGTRFLLNTVLTQKIGCGDTKKWRYALETNFGTDSNAADGGGGGHANWWGFANYLFYDLNDCWTFGFRQEYMDDSEGAVIAQVGPPSFAPVGSRYNDLTLSANYKPNKNVMIRAEIRGDFAGNGQTTNLPFGSNNNNNDQFLFDTDLIVRF